MRQDRTAAGSRIERALTRLEAVMAALGPDSEEAHALRDEMESDWPVISDTEEVFLRGLSADLYQLSDQEMLPPQADPRPAAELLHQLMDAYRSQDGFGVLELLRNPALRGVIPDSEQVLVARARAYEWSGYDWAAYAFHTACYTRFGDEGAWGLGLTALARCDAAGAEALIAELEAAVDPSPLRLAHAAIVDFQLLRTSGGTEGLMRIAELGLRAYRANQVSPVAWAMPVAWALVARALAQLRLGEGHQSLESLDLAASVQKNAAVLLARGWVKLQLGHPKAYVDLVDAFRDGVSGLDPRWYAVAAYRSFLDADYARCRAAAAFGLSVASASAMRADLHHVMALSGALSGRSRDEVLAHFEAALQTGGLDGTIAENHRRYLHDAWDPPAAFLPSSSPQAPPEPAWFAVAV